VLIYRNAIRINSSSTAFCRGFGSGLSDSAKPKNAPVKDLGAGAGNPGRKSGSLEQARDIVQPAPVERLQRGAGDGIMQGPGADRDLQHGLAPNVRRSRTGSGLWCFEAASTLR